MDKRRGDVSEDLFARTEPEKQEDSKPVKQEAVETVKRPTDETSSSREERQDDEKPIKVTYYLPPQLANELTRGQLEITELTGLRGHDIAKSAIVEVALEMALDDLKVNQHESVLVTRLKKRAEEGA